MPKTTPVNSAKKMHAMANKKALPTSPRCIVAAARRSFLDMSRLACQYADKPILAEHFAEMRDIAEKVKDLTEANIAIAPVDMTQQYGIGFQEWLDVGREVKGFNYAMLYTLDELSEMYSIPRELTCKIIAEYY